MNFAQIVHGDIGHLVAGYLPLRPLSQLARCNKNGRTLVEYRYSHFMYLNLDDYMQNHAFSSEHQDWRFASMCQRLKGIEVLQWSVNHPQLVSGVDKTTKTDSQALALFYSCLLLGSLNRLRVLQVRRSDNTSQGEFGKWCHHDPILTLIHCLPRLEILELVDFNIAQDQVGELITSQKTIYEFGTDAHEALHPRGSTLLEIMPREIAMEVYDLDMPLMQLQPYRLQYLRKLSSLSLVLNQLRTLVRLMPQIEVATLKLVTTKSDFNQIATDEEEEKNTYDSSSSSDIASSFLIFQLPPGDHIIVPLWSRLVFLSLHCASDGTAIPRHTIIEVRSPGLLGLNLQVDPIVLDDIILELPQAIGIGLSLTCLYSRKVTITSSGVEVKEETKSDEQDEKRKVAMPPSLIHSLRHSTRLRSLNTHPVDDASALNEDWRTSLTPDERTQMDEKFATIGVDQDQRHNESMYAYCERVFYYALSALPCAAALEYIEQSPRGVSIPMSEFCSLFPAVRSFSLTPKLPITMPEWASPSNDRAIGATNVIEEKFLKSTSQRLEFEPSFLCDDYWQIAEDGFEIDRAVGDLISRSGRFDQLTTLYLSTPTRVAESALTAIFVKCRELRHASLIQLVGVGNEIFMNLPLDCIRPSLQTLRLKSECCPTPDFDHFDSSILETLMRVFPAIEHFEFISATFNESLLTTLHKSLLQLLDLPPPASSTRSPFQSTSRSRELLNKCIIMNWPLLRILSVNHHRSSSSASKQSKWSDQDLLHHLLISRTQIQAEMEATESRSTFSKRELKLRPRELNFVTIEPKPARSIADWIRSSRTVVEDKADNKVNLIPSLANYTEPCCQAHLCSVKSHHSLASATNNQNENNNQEEEEEEEEEEENDHDIFDVQQ